MSQLKLIFQDITENNHKIVFSWYGQKLIIESKNIEIRNSETDEIMSTKDNYYELFGHCRNILDKLLDLLDIDLFTAWNIYYEQERFANINSWEEWEGIESIEDLHLNIKKIDHTKIKLNEFLDEKRGLKSKIQDLINY